MSEIAPSASSFAEPSDTATERKHSWRRALAHRGFMTGAIVLVCIALMAVFAPLLAPHDPYLQDLLRRRIPPVWDLWFNESSKATWEHPLGTDQIGRDFLSRIIYGSRVSLLVAFLATALSAVIGITMGMLGGYFGKAVDAVINFLIITRLSLPIILIALAVVSIYGGSLIVMIMVLGLLNWDKFAIVARAETLRLGGADYVKAARAIGCSTPHILLRQILPNLASSLIVIATYEMGAIVLTEASLSFLGMGVQPPTPSWGLMLSEARSEILFNAWMIMIPGVAIFTLVMTINLVGDGLRDIVEPRGLN